MANYVDNKTLYNNICLWKADCRAKGYTVKIPDSIGKDILLISKGFAGYYKFVNYTNYWRDEMIADAIEDIIRGLHNFDETKYTNPHAYITQACFNSFIQRIKKEKRSQATKYKYFMNHVYDCQDEDMVKVIDNEVFQNIHDKLTDYDISIKKVSTKKQYTGPTLDDFFNRIDPDTVSDNHND